jgi:hypothetical protein
MRFPGIHIRLSHGKIVVAVVAISLACAAEAVRVIDGRSGRSRLSQAAG